MDKEEKNDQEDKGETHILAGMLSTASGSGSAPCEADDDGDETEDKEKNGQTSKPKKIHRKKKTNKYAKK